VPAENSLLGKTIEGTIFDFVEGVIRKKRVEMPELEVKSRIRTFEEVDQVISEKNARREAARCLDCCRICYNRDA